MSKKTEIRFSATLSSLPTLPVCRMKELLHRRTPTKKPEELEAAYGQGLLRKEELVHGAHYRGTCRNANVARWHGGHERFVYIRHKFGSSFLEKICHPVDEPHFDVFLAVELIDPADLAGGVVEDEAFERFFAGDAD